MTAAHTPGPWRIVTRLGFYKPKSKCYIAGPEINPALASTPEAGEHAPLVACVEWHRSGSADRWPVRREEQEANAALIAAAPELLAALVAIGRGLTQGQRDRGETPGTIARDTLDRLGFGL